MWTVWKREIVGISLATVLGICALVLFINAALDAKEQSAACSYAPHLVIEDTVYWQASSWPGYELPDGYTEIARIETSLSGGPAKNNGEAWAIAAGTPVYGNKESPGWVYIPTDTGRWDRYVVLDLNRSFLRYNGVLYLSVTSIPHELDTNIPIETEKFLPTGETVSWPGDWDVLPTQDCTTNISSFSGREILLNPEQSDVVLLKHTITKSGEDEERYAVFISASSLGLDYSEYLHSNTGENQ